LTCDTFPGEKRGNRENTSETTRDSIAQMKKNFVQLADAQKEMQELKQELQGQLAEIMQILRSRPSA
jgi:uncharacterized protein involved in exopolysaccharide biosynthesis